MNLYHFLKRFISPKPIPRLPVIAGPKMSIAGEFLIEVRRGGELVTNTGWFDNLITDGGLDRLATGLVICQYGSIGTGTTAPANGNTALVAFVAQVNGAIADSNSNGGTPNYIAQGTVRWVFAQGAVVGNMAEVGAGWGASGTNLFSRALILDGGGAPTTLTLTSLDQLTLYYRDTVTPATTDLTGTVTLGGQTYNYTGRMANANNWNNDFTATMLGQSSIWPKGSGSSGNCMHAYSTQTLGALNLTPTGTVSNGAASNTITTGSYSAGQKYLDTIFTALPAECNSSGGVGAIVFDWQTSQMTYQYSFVNASGGATIPKDNTKTMSFTIRLSWDRA